MKYVNFCLLAIASLALSAGSVNTDTLSTGYYPGELIPSLVLKDDQGNLLDRAEYKDKKVVVNFWAAYDSRSRANNVLLHNYLKQNYPDVELLSISFDSNDKVFEKTVLLDQLDRHSQFCDTLGMRSDIFRDFRLKKGFKNYLVDEQGKIIAMNVSPQELQEVLSKS